MEIDNNLVENGIRPTVLGRNNFMFSGSHEGAQRSAMIYSFLGSCKMNNVNPKEWLADVLLRLPDTKIFELINLLPSNWKKQMKELNYFFTLGTCFTGGIRYCIAFVLEKQEYAKNLAQ